MAAAIIDLVGPAAGIATSICWTATAIFFTSASRRLGPTLVNGLRLILAVLMLGLTLRLLDGQSGVRHPWRCLRTLPGSVGVGARGLLGALCAVGGAALLFVAKSLRDRVSDPGPG